MPLIDFIKALVLPQKENLFAPEDAVTKWECTWQHAKDSHAHVQSVIQFIDTKTSMLVGISAIVTAGVASAPFWIMSLDKDAHERMVTALATDRCLTGALVVFWAASLATGVCSLMNALLSTIARQPNHIDPYPISPELDTHGLPKTIVLFPISSKARLMETAALLRTLRSGIDYAQVIKEYEKQLLVTGAILYNKIQYNRRAVIWLMAHIIIASIMVVAFAVVSIL